MSGPHVVSGFSIFNGISDNHLIEISQHVELLEFDTGDIIFKEGEEADKLYGVVNGEVDLVLVVRDEIQKTDVKFEEYAHTETMVTEREIVVDTIREGEILGWTAMTPAGKFTARAVCAEPTKLFALPAKSLKTFFEQQPHVGYHFMEQLAEIISSRFTNRTDKLIEGWVEAFAVNRI